MQGHEIEGRGDGGGVPLEVGVGEHRAKSELRSE